MSCLSRQSVKLLPYKRQYSIYLYSIEKVGHGIPTHLPIETIKEQINENVD